MSRNDVRAVLAERGAAYGDFTDQAALSRALKYYVMEHPNYECLSMVQREAVDMILHKISRIVNGNPNILDHWIDISGYAMLAADRIGNVEYMEEETGLTKEVSIMMHIESPRTGDQAIEADIRAKGKTAPRVKPANIEANIASEHYFTASQGVAGASYVTHDANDRGPLSLLTFCVLVLRNGLTVTGESAYASPANFDAEIGRRIARDNAVNKIWPLMDYELRLKLAVIENLKAGH